MKRRDLLISMGLASVVTPLSMRSVQAGECEDTSEHSDQVMVF
jgi:hypothetical protein